jgi:hypothetical protein|tara:strand:- start:3439 stop:3807 length:369 start_codon:yes stop_codon:yes gene_type:complete
MAKYIKFNLTNPGAATGDELLINIDQITRIATVSTTTTDIFFDNIVTATKKWRVTHIAPLVANDILNAIQAAMTANPGGVVSTVGGPVATAQIPARQGGNSGRIPVTTAQVNVTYTSAAFTA